MTVDTPDRRRQIAYLVAFLGLWVVLFWLTTELQQGLLAFLLSGLLPGLRRLADLACLPFTVLLATLLPPDDHHFPPGHYATRAMLASGFYVSLAALLHGIWRRWRHRTTAASRGKDPGWTRRQTLTLGGTAVVGTGAAAAVGWPVLVVPARLRVARHEVTIPGLPTGLDGLRIGHLSDTHFGPYIGSTQIHRAITRVHAEDPDLIVLTGDYVHRHPETIAPGIGLLADLHARHGVVAVLGNHDHWEGVDACRRAFASAGIPLLDNHRLFLTPHGLRDHEFPGRSLAVCGIGDLWEDAVDPDRALTAVSDSCPRLLLSHNPDAAETLPASHPGARFDLQLSGHTHGGQVRIPGMGTPVVPSRYGSRYAGGLCQGPGWPVVVSRGVGMAVAPVRYGVRPEVGVITLRG